jgi:hypothetical protein
MSYVIGISSLLGQTKFEGLAEGGCRVSYGTTLKCPVEDGDHILRKALETPFFLEPWNIKSLGAIWNFGKATGLP